MLRIACCLVLICGLAGCKTALDRAYINTLGAFGQEKREVLVDRVDAARDSQEEAGEQFASALDAFVALTGYDGGELAERYDVLSREFERSEDRADAVRSRIERVETAADALFDEWEDELGQYTDPDLRRRSEAQLRQTRTRYDDLLAVMQRAAARMDPVLDAFRDQVLFLKHNLNARAVAALDDEAAALETDVAALIRDMNTAIREAARFIDEMQGVS